MKKNYLDRAMKARDPRFAKIARRLSVYERRDMVAATPAAPVIDEAAELRTRYTALSGKRPFMGWDAETLRQKIKDMQ